MIKKSNKNKIKLLLFSFFIVMPCISDNYAGVLPVYYPTTLSPKVRQDILKSEITGDNVDFVVFGKFKDFIDQVKGSNPDFVIAPSAFARYNKEYKPVLQFSSKVGPDFSYMLLSLSQSWTAQSVTQSKAGAVEEVQREFLKDYLSEILDGSPKMIKTVSKTEDLFPLLIFKSADFIMLSPENYEKLKEQFTVKVYNVAKSKPIKNPMLFAREGSVLKAVAAKIQAMPAPKLAGLGFTKVDALSRGVASDGQSQGGGK